MPCGQTYYAFFPFRRMLPESKTLFFEYHPELSALARALLRMQPRYSRICAGARNVRQLGIGAALGGSQVHNYGSIYRHTRLESGALLVPCPTVFDSSQASHSRDGAGPSIS